jgi:hypothetical protein
MDIKSDFLNGPIKKEVYMEQPLGFKSEEYPKEHGMNALEIF